MSKSVNIDFVTRQIEVDTDGKEYYVSAAMAAKNAEQSMLNAEDSMLSAQNAATSVQKYKALWFDSVAAMKAEPSLTAGAYVCTAGYYTPNDGGGASYLIRAKADSDTADGGSLHELSNGLVAELIIENGTVCPEQFGAIANGVADDTNAIQRVLNLGRYRIVFDSKTYVASQLFPKSGNNILLSNGTVLKQKPYQTSAIFISIKNQENISIDGGTVCGNCDTAIDQNEYGDAINISNASKHISITNMKIMDAVGDGIDCTSGRRDDGKFYAEDIVEDIYINNIVFENNGASDVGCEGAKNVIATNLIMQGGKRFMPKCAIDLEPNDDNVGNENIYIANVVHDGTTQGIYLPHRNKNVTLKNIVSTSEIACGYIQGEGTLRWNENIHISNCSCLRLQVLNTRNSIVDNVLVSNGCSFEWCDGTIIKNCIIERNGSNQVVSIAYNKNHCIFENNTIKGDTLKYYISCSDIIDTINEIKCLIRNNLIINSIDKPAILVDADYLFYDNVIANTKYGKYYYSNDKIARTVGVIDSQLTNISCANYYMPSMSYYQIGAMISPKSKEKSRCIYLCTQAGYTANMFNRLDNTSYKVGDTVYKDDYVFRAISSGTTDTTSPSFTYNVGDTILDGTVTWECLGAKAVFSYIQYVDA